MSDLYEQVQTEWACTHSEMVLRRRVSRSGAESFAQQCQTCGAAVLTIKKATLSAAVRERALPFDEALKERWWKERSADYQRRRDDESRAWWDGYNAYLSSPEWQERRRRVLERDQNRCKACERRPATQVHHLTYRHVGHEPLFDLVAVCDSCHEALTKADREARTA